MSEGAGVSIAELDEMLELLFWLEGEGLSSSANVPGIARFIAKSEADARRALEVLLLRGDVTDRQGTGFFVLTEVGRREAGRRFVEDFKTLLAQGHGECNDPNCDCKTSPAGAADCQAHRSSGT